MADLEFRYVSESSELQILSGGYAVRPNRQDVLNALKVAGYETYYLNESALKTVLESWPSDPVWVSIGEKRNAMAEVFISKDKMSATLELTSPQGGYGISTDLIVDCFRRHGLVVGIDSNEVNELMRKAQALAGGHSASSVVAHGIAPQHGEDSQFKPLVQTLGDRILAPREHQEEEFDFRDFGDLPSVIAGTPLLQRIPATVGVAGKNVLGEVIEANPGKEYPFSQQAGSAISPKDPDLLIATRAGLPVTHLRGMSVDDVYVVNEVSLATGHIRFEGNITVQKDVGRNMEVNAGGMVHIGGFVDSALIVAGGDMVIAKGLSGGLAGNLDELITEARSHGNAWVQFSQFSKLSSEQHIVAEKMLFHCSAKAKGAVRVGPEGTGKGKLVGGEICAEHWVKSDYLGDENQIRTVIRLNESAMLRKQVIVDLQKRIDDKMIENRQLKAVMDRPQARGNSELLNRIKSTYKDGMAQMVEMEKERMRLLAEWEAQLKGSVVVVTRQLFPGVEITIADKTWKVNRVFGPGSVRYDGDRLNFYSGEIAVPAFTEVV